MSLEAVDRLLKANIESLSRSLYPKTFYEIQLWAEEFRHHIGMYSTGCSKAIQYYINDLELYLNQSKLSGSKSLTYETEIINTYNYKTLLKEIGEELVFTGNAFATYHIPFIRFLSCPKCGSRYQLSKLYDANHKVNFNGSSFSTSCLNKQCNSSGKFKVIDIPQEVNDEVKPTIFIWPVEAVSLKYHPLSCKTEYFIDVRKDVCLLDGVTRKERLFLENTEMGILETFASSGTLFKVDNSRILHLKENPPASLCSQFRGYGMPRFINGCFP